MEDQQSTNREEATKTQQRPTGVLILAVLHIVGICLGTVMFLVPFVQPDQLPNNFEEMGISIWKIILNMAIIGFLILFSGIGMLLGKKWGWYFAAYYYLNSLLRSGYTLLIIEQIYIHLDPADPEIQQAYTKYGGRFVIQLLLLLYLFRDNVLTFFGLQTKRKYVSLAGIIAICILQSIITAFLPF